VSVDRTAPATHVELILAPRGLKRVTGLLRRMGAFALVELQKLTHDRSELLTRMVQP
jgi:ABC-2 type transport system permease protein